MPRVWSGRLDESFGLPLQNIAIPCAFFGHLLRAANLFYFSAIIFLDFSSHSVCIFSLHFDASNSFPLFFSLATFSEVFPEYLGLEFGPSLQTS